jgi:hypothetical protein
MHTTAFGDLTIRPLPGGDGEHHALAAYADGGVAVAAARLTRDPFDRRRAELVAAPADGVAAQTLVDLLTADARAIGITTLVRGDDRESPARPITRGANVDTLTSRCTQRQSHHEAA